MKTNIDVILKTFDRVVEALRNNDVLTVAKLKKITELNSVKLSKILTFLLVSGVINVRLFGKYMIVGLTPNWKDNYEKFKKEFVEKGYYNIFYEKVEKTK